MRVADFGRGMTRLLKMRGLFSMSGMGVLKMWGWISISTVGVLFFCSGGRKIE